MELRDIEIFLTLAEELHFGRTAERLHVTTARVSQAIKKQERRIGAALFERDNRRVSLTPIGLQLFGDLKPMYDGLRDGIERAALAARGKTGTLVLGMVNENPQDLRPLFDAFRSRRPECDLQLRYAGFADPFRLLRSGDIDLLIAWLPVREPDLTVGPVVSVEDVVLVVGPDHRLAGWESVSYEDLGDEIVFGGARPDYWRNWLVPTHTPSGRLIRIGPIVTTSAEMTPLIANSEAVSPCFAHSIRYYARPDHIYLPIRDAPVAQWALIWRTATESALIRDFAATARELGPLAL
ncbi:DNA-binding transcriptional regulator, LysR family [Nonomuraea solani]|uniref:DNA-binding transcriptional regulator, LysR family n=1 Tax=Nonomuraea solani TaxID=1144553 RepID=A0A1H6EI99_9ACTN|nr:LysR family transcriptional regulator [Nonomuraea solani]SEG96565.1 DNA-binding transcriptional regulator, LysR family [Nonomuraea solani]